MHRVLVTGGSGFIGSHLVEALLKRGDQVVVVDDESTGNRDNLSSVESSTNLEFIAGSAGDESLISELVARSDRVYHLAAAVGVALIAKKPIETIERNIYPTQLLFANLRQQFEAGRDVRVFLASTSEVYGKNPKPTWTEEDDIVLGATTKARWSYGASKAIDEFLALACWREFHLPVVIGRFFNVVGPRQSGAYGMVLPRFVEAAKAGRPIVVHDDGAQTRCFAHVADVVTSVLELMDDDAAAGRVYNIGSDHPISILDLAKLVIEVTGSDSPVEFQSYTEAYDRDFEDIRRRVPDLTRLRNTICHRPQFDLRDIIQQIWDAI